MDNSPVGYVTNCCIQFYTVEELTRAKDIIWDVADTDIVGPYIRRRDGPKRSAVDNVAADITGAIQKLDLAGMVPKVAVDPRGLNRIPKVIPAETNALSMCERLVVMESRIKQLEESMSDNVCKTISISEKVNNMTSYANAVTGQVVSSASPNPHLQVSQQQRIQTQIGNQQITSGSSNPVRYESSLQPAVARISDVGRSNRVDMMRSSSQQSIVSAISQQSAPFQLQRTARKKLKRRDAPVVGTGRSDRVRGAPEPSRDLFVYRVQNDITANDINLYVTGKNVDVRDVIQKSKEGSRFMSFKVTVKVSDLNTILKPDFWPTGVCVRRFWEPRSDNYRS
jgi:hypothetical protein